jgi:hypothetical protein
MEDDPIPASIWHSETHHRKIWQGQGPCVRCGFRPREILCGRCMDPFCAVCLIEHYKETEHSPKTKSAKA